MPRNNEAVNGCKQTLIKLLEAVSTECLRLEEKLIPYALRFPPILSATTPSLRRIGKNLDVVTRRGVCALGTVRNWEHSLNEKKQIHVLWVPGLFGEKPINMGNAKYRIRRDQI